MDELSELRNQIDEIDDALISLLLQRMEISRQVAEYKVKKGIPVLNRQREQEILDAVAAKCGEQGDAIKTIISAVMDASRALQHQIIGGGKELRELIGGAYRCERLAVDGKPVACCDADGDASRKAAAAFFPGSTVDGYHRTEDVLEALRRGTARFGIIPVENSTAGSVHELYDLIMQYRFYVAGAYEIRRPGHNISEETNRCLVICKEPVLESNADVLSLIFSVPHGPSSLCRVLGRFAMAGLNLTKLASRSVADGESDCLFYAEMNGSVDDAATLDLFCALHDELPKFKFLGNYREIKA